MALLDDLLTPYLEGGASDSYDLLTELCLGLSSSCMCFYLMRDLEMSQMLAMMHDTLQLSVTRLLVLFMGNAAYSGRVSRRPLLDGRGVV